MARTAYLDSSAIIKLLQHERESEALVHYITRPMRAIASALCVTEVGRAARRARVDLEEATAVLEALDLVELTQAQLARAARLDPVSLRSLDAIHLAAAMTSSDPDLEFVTYDAVLAGAARANGLKVVQPGR